MAINHQISAANPIGTNDMETSMHTDSPQSYSSIEWTLSLGCARQLCAQVFRDGGSPADALKAYGVTSTVDATDWSKAVELIAETLGRHQALRRAA